MIKVAIDAKKMRELGITDLRPGATVMAKVHCGQTSVGYAWFHDVIAFVQIANLVQVLVTIRLQSSFGVHRNSECSKV